MDRIAHICAFLDPCNVFADVGCDHGYCTRYMLEHRLCRRAVIADISEKCLSKAENLLRPYIAEGSCRAVCCDGLTGVERTADEVLIAGMGGEEIIKICRQSFIPEKFVFQPMKNAPELRKFLLDSGCRLLRDDVFRDGKFYFILKGVRASAPFGGERPYSEAELRFGRDSLANPVFGEYLDEEIPKYRYRLSVAPEGASRRVLDEKIKYLQGVKSGEIK